jgi:hypothetical protein
MTFLRSNSRNASPMLVQSVNFKSVMDSLEDQAILWEEDVELERWKVCCCCLLSSVVMEGGVDAWRFRNCSRASVPWVEIRKSSRTPAP